MVSYPYILYFRKDLVWWMLIWPIPQFIASFGICAMCIRYQISLQESLWLDVSAMSPIVVVNVSPLLCLLSWVCFHCVPHCIASSNTVLPVSSQVCTEMANWYWWISEGSGLDTQESARSGGAYMFFSYNFILLNSNNYSNHPSGGRIFLAIHSNVRFPEWKDIHM